MMKIRRSEERGYVNRGWLEGRFSFSFAEYDDPEYRGFRALRVINDDRIAAGKGFGPHAHRDMEIVTYVLEGHLLHRDSTGEHRVIGPNEIQAMTAGSGIVHSEFNASDTEPVRSIQIWISPSSEDLTPAYQQISFAPEEKRGRLRLLAGPAPLDARSAAAINQDARLYVSELGANENVSYQMQTDRHAWVQVLRGTVSMNRELFKEGDCVAVSGERDLSFSGAGAGGEFLLFDLA